MSRASGKIHSGKATCGKGHTWGATWEFVPVTYTYNGREHTRQEERVTPALCPHCGGKALSLKEKRS